MPRLHGYARRFGLEVSTSTNGLQQRVTNPGTDVLSTSTKVKEQELLYGLQTICPCNLARICESQLRGREGK